VLKHLRDERVASGTRVEGDHARVLITVKTAPQPSSQYGDTVCVAGIRIDREPYEWVRLYPIPFRYLGTEQQFHKYDVVDVTIRRRYADPRPESYSPELESISRVSKLRGWKERLPVMSKVARTSFCELRAGIVADTNGPSLGLVPVGRVSKLSFEANPG
jgi:hypothetical protein